MTTEIKQMWFVPKYNLSITEDGKVFTSDLKECPEVFHQGQLKFRIPGTAVRISRKYIKKNCIVQPKVMQAYCPF